MAQSFVPSASGKTYDLPASDSIELATFPNLESFLYKAHNIPQTISEKEYEQANSELTGSYKKIEKITSDSISLIEKKADAALAQASERLNKQLDVLNRNQKELSKEFTRRAVIELLLREKKFAPGKAPA